MEAGEAFHVENEVWATILMAAAEDFGWSHAIVRSPGKNGEVICALFADEPGAEDYLATIPDTEAFTTHRIELPSLYRLCCDLKLQGFTHVSFDFRPGFGFHKTIWTIDGFISELSKPPPNRDPAQWN